MLRSLPDWWPVAELGVGLEPGEASSVAFMEQLTLADVAPHHRDAAVPGLLHDVAFGGATGSRRSRQAVAFAMIGWGVSRLLGGDVFGGLWTAFIGWFLNSGAEASRQQQGARTVLSGVPVTTVMETAPAVAAPTLSVQDFVFEHTLRHGHRALPVVDGVRLVGLMSITDAKHLAHAAWPTTPVSDVMTPMPLKTLAPEADLNAALALMVANGVNQIPVVQDGALVGMLSRADVMRYMHLGHELHLRGSDLSPGMSKPQPAHSHG